MPRPTYVIALHMHFIFISPERLQRRFAGGGCCNAAPDSRIKYATTPLTLLSASLILDKSVRIF